MRILVTGGRGLLGSALVPLLGGHDTRVLDVEDGDVADSRALRGPFEAFAPDFVVHLAAMTDVDRCESEPEEAFRVNETGSRTVASEAERVGAAVVTLSTDYVFDGRGRTEPYREDDAPSPLSVYGRSKLAGEAAVQAAASRWAVVRTAWLYGSGGRNFVDTMARLLCERESVRVVNDQVGSPTYAADLARGLLSLLESGVRGHVHLVNGGRASWFEVAREVARHLALDPGRVEPQSTAELGRPAPRPAYSVLDARRARDQYRVELRPWTEALKSYLSGKAAPARPGGNA